jgi:hypothetical protein
MLLLRKKGKQKMIQSMLETNNEGVGGVTGTTGQRQHARVQRGSVMGRMNRRRVDLFDLVDTCDV